MASAAHVGHQQGVKPAEAVPHTTLPGLHLQLEDAVTCHNHFGNI